MRKSYLNKIKAKISITTTKKTSNILEGTYKSIYKGRSMNFEDLREYVIGDNVKDIDWKASARSRNLLVKQFVAEKKHNILTIIDSGSKMDADTEKCESKKDVAIMLAGTIGYITNRNGDYFGSIFRTDKGIEYFQLKSDVYNIERILATYDLKKSSKKDSNINEIVEYVTRSIKKRMIIFIITDIDGVHKLDSNTLKKLCTLHDVLVFCIDDAKLTGNNVYDVNELEYVPSILLNNKKLLEIEKNNREIIKKENDEKLKKLGITLENVDTENDVVSKVIELLERHKYANKR